MKEKKFKLPKEFGINWLEALRSGNHKQTNEMLFKKTVSEEGDFREGYCCLGVALSILGVSDGILNAHTLPLELEVLPKKFPEILQGDKDLGEILTVLNDGCSISGIEKYEKEYGIKLPHSGGQSCTFEEIANWIEENVEFI